MTSAPVARVRDHVRGLSILWAFLTAAIVPLTLPAQQRLLLPEGTVVTVRTQAALSSQTAQEGQTLRTTVTDSVSVDGFTVIPEGSTIDGSITLVRRANRQQSGVIGVEFTRLQLPNGAATAIDAKLTSTDPGERRQIDAQPNAGIDAHLLGRSCACLSQPRCCSQSPPRPRAGNERHDLSL